MKNLVIVESPSKSKTIEKYLGKDYKVLSSKGHIRDLATSGTGGLGVNVEGDFSATYKVSKEKKDIVKELKSHAEKAKHVYLATDPDREGEAISWHLAMELGINLDQSNRVVFNEITKNAVLKAFDHPRQIDMDLVKSQETRRILDRIIGFKLSKLLQKKIHSKSAGRVQSVALHLIIEREKEIAKFKPEEYWKVKALFHEQKQDFEASLEKYLGKKLRIESQQQVDEIVSKLSGAFKLAQIKESTRKKESRLVFTTSTLQQEAANKISFNSKKTMRVAQKLYEGININGTLEGLITYMRTDSTRLSNEFVQVTFDYIEQTYGKKYVGKYRFNNKNEATQDAHEGIRVTDITKTPDQMKAFLTNDEFKLYKLIYARTLASLMAAAQQKTLAYTFEKEGYQFVANGLQTIFDGYMAVYHEYETSSETSLPMLVDNELYQPVKIASSQHFTQPPLRYNEARLIKEMEENGIGRPSTYAMTMETIVSRGYVEYKAMSEGTKNKVFIPTDQGFLTDQKLQESFNSVINVEYTANMEKELDEIADGQLNHVDSLKDFYGRFDSLVQKAYLEMESTPVEHVGRTCPNCGGELIYKYSRFGKFIGCANYPECKHVEQLDGKKKEPPRLAGEDCPNCGKPLVYRKSRYGSEFIACSGFPKCRYIKPNSTVSPKVLKQRENDEKAK